MINPSLDEAKKVMVVLCGVMGSGKSTLAADLKKIGGVGWQVVSQEDMLGVEEQCCAAEVVLGLRRENVIVDRVNSDEGQRRVFVEAAKRLRVMCVCVWVCPPLETCIEQLKSRGSAHPRFHYTPQNASITRQTYASFHPPTAFEGFAHIFRITTPTQRETTLQCLALLGGGVRVNPIPLTKQGGKKRALVQAPHDAKRRRLEELLEELNISSPCQEKGERMEGGDNDDAMTDSDEDGCRAGLKKMWQQKAFMMQ
eukprot:TRINITY_DN42851_c0_g1_i1.p1 TRINITY_DN42851_c0_g1~~TRINITY_DN42851_c0_g1_i1.p1  ORF type:complete len:255 (+),score=51.67 TRINITY_DN42851_c0_g1_i1:40-804(+)